MRDADQVADQLVQLYKMPFNGKGRGKYQIRAWTFKELAGRARLDGGFVHQVNEALGERGFAFIDLEGVSDASGFAVVRGARVMKWRRAGIGRRWKATLREVVADPQSGR